ncbi:MAG: LPS export ABC transporter periplasmic protein LptC [Mariprofundaceae bacterium]
MAESRGFSLWHIAGGLWLAIAVMARLSHPLCWMKWGFLAISLMSLITAIIMIWYQPNEFPTKSPSEDAATGTEVDQPFIVERKQGRVVWRLRAKKAEQATGGMRLTRPKLELLTESNAIVSITSAKGWVAPFSDGLSFEGGVEVRFETWLLQCEKLIYDGRHEELQVPDTFMISGDGMHVEGRGLRAEKTGEHIWIEDGVKVESAHRGGINP